MVSQFVSAFKGVLFVVLLSLSTMACAENSSPETKSEAKSDISDSAIPSSEVSSSTSAHSNPDPIVTHQVEGKFSEVLANIRAAITGKGINIAHELGASDMLNRTGPDFGYKTNVYSDAQIVEFCSASLSHKLVQIDPDNNVLCPFAISVYSITKEPGFVRMSYRVPVGKPGSEAVIKEVVALLESVIEDAQW